MARTKQTARKCIIVNNKKSIHKKSPTNRKRNNRFNPSQSDSQNEESIHQPNNQQFSVKFDDQDNCEESAVVGQIIYCSSCQAVFTSQGKSYSKAEYKKFLSKPSVPDQKKQMFLQDFDLIWICEFCLTENIVPKKYKPPVSENPCFLIQKGNLKKKKNLKEEENDDANKILVFCIDISTSMSFLVRGDKTRLDSVKQAIIDQINRMNFQKEVIKVGLVTFGMSVTLIGDANTFKEKELNPGIFMDFDKIVQQAAKVTKFASPIIKSHKSLKKKIHDLDVFGSTALGPALLASIEIASKGGVGSKVIICTDGEANIGLGSIDMKQAPIFYEKAGSFAKKKRVQVSILSLKGDKCNLKQLGKLSLASGGSILKIDPANLGTQFAKIVKEEILGTQSELMIKVNKIFEIISDDPKELSLDKTTLTQNLGNFSAQTQITFAFKVLSKQQAAKKPGVNLDLFTQARIPMQVQLTYIGRDGNKYKQVITDWRQTTENQKEIYEGANFGLFAASVLQRASAKIKAQQFDEAQKIIKGYWSVVEKNFSISQNKKQLTKFGDRVKKLEIVLDSKLKKNNKNPGLRTKNSRQRSRNKLKKPVSIKKKGKKKRFSDSSPQSQDCKSQSECDNVMSSDEQEEILWRQMRARSRSNSPQKKSK